MNKISTFFCGAILGAVVLIAGCSGGSSPAKPAGASSSGLPVTAVKLVSSSGAEYYVNAEVALTQAQQATGLMNRSYMGSNDGMLFVFGSERTLSFWMKNTLIPLDMIFIDSGKRIVDINENAAPMSEATFTARAPAKYVLEVNGGYCARNDIRIGGAVGFDGY